MWSSPHDITAPDQRPIAKRVTPRAGWLLAGIVIAFAFVGLTVRTLGGDWSAWERTAAFVVLAAVFTLLWTAWRRAVRRAAARADEPSPV